MAGTGFEQAWELSSPSSELTVEEPARRDGPRAGSPIFDLAGPYGTTIDFVVSTLALAL